MTTIALANLPFPSSPDASVAAVEAAIAEAGAAGCDLICFPECFVPGYRALGAAVPIMDAEWLVVAHRRLADAAGRAGVALVLGTERWADGDLRISALVVGPDGVTIGWQDKVQLDPSEDRLYQPGQTRQLFEVAGLAFGVVICHEGFRYPETVRWAARAGAQLVFHPHFSQAEPGGWHPGGYAESGNSFHEAAARCRAAENGLWYATVNCAGEDSPTTSAVIDPDGEVLAWQPHGQAGLLIAEIDPGQASPLLGARLRPVVAG
jgi:Predicted amidohydrolase